MKTNLKFIQNVVLNIVFDIEIISILPGFISFLIKGNKSLELFKNEIGLHQIQRGPPTEKRGRIHTSLISIAVIQKPEPYIFSLNQKEIEIKTCRSSGPGGQNVNKTESAVQVTHIPTGIMVRCESERSQQQNKETAINALTAKIWNDINNKNIKNQSDNIRHQIGFGSTQTKRRTLRFQDNVVIDHITNNKWTIKEYLKGNW